MNLNILDNIDFQVETDLLFKQTSIPNKGDYKRRLIELAHIAGQIGKPKVMYKEVAISARGDGYVIADKIKLESYMLRNNLVDTQKIYPYILTCGRELADWAASLEDLLEQFWADKIMELALKSATAALETDLEAHFNLVSTSNMNPGSLEDWPLREQEKLFAILADVEQEIGVVLTDSFLMLPIKSLSGIRFFSREEFINCKFCDRDRCPDRRMGYDHSAYKIRYK